MKRKDYQKPTMRVVKLQHRTCMLTGSPLTSTSTRQHLGQINATTTGPQGFDSPAGHKEKNLGNNKFNLKTKQ